MLFKKYQVMIFKEREGHVGGLKLRGWFGAVLVLVLLGLTASTTYLWTFYDKSRLLTSQIREAEKTIQEQNSQIVSMAGKLQSLREDITRIQQFDSKLRVMMNLDKDPTDIGTNAGGPAAPGLSQPLPLYRQELLSRRVHSLLDQLSADSRLEELQQQNLLHILRENRDFLASTPSIWPAEGFLSSTFGGRSSPFGGGGELHKGLDIANRPGTPVRAPAKGTVIFAGWDGAYGNSIIINHGNNITTRYAHMNSLLVKEKQNVNRGDVIGSIGNTGRSTGPHLHYEVRVGGVAVNPLRYILN